MTTCPACDHGRMKQETELLPPEQSDPRYPGSGVRVFMECRECGHIIDV